MGRDVVGVAAVTLVVPDAAATADFFEHALEYHRWTERGTEHLTAQGEYGFPAPRRMLSLRSGPGPAVAEIALELAAGDSGKGLRARLEHHGVDHEVVDGGAVRFADPDGLVIVAAPREPPLDHPLAASGVRPRRLGHVNLKVRDAARSAAFYIDVVGLARSEQIGRQLYFLRAGSEHHNLGLRGGAEEPAVHHVAFEVAGWDSYRVVCDHLAALGHVVEYGPGRHGPGNNLFVYLRDPSSGLRLELYSDMAHIHDEQGYEPPVWESSDRPRTVNRWGPAPPASFLE